MLSKKTLASQAKPALRLVFSATKTGTEEEETECYIPSHSFSLHTCLHVSKPPPLPLPMIITHAQPNVLV